MKQIEEIFKKHNSGFSHREQYPPFFEDIVEMMKDYAESCMNQLIDEIHVFGEIDDKWGDGYEIVNSRELIKKVLNTDNNTEDDDA